MNNNFWSCRLYSTGEAKRIGLYVTIMVSRVGKCYHLISQFLKLCEKNTNMKKSLYGSGMYRNIFFFIIIILRTERHARVEMPRIDQSINSSVFLKIQTINVKNM